MLELPPEFAIESGPQATVDQALPILFGLTMMSVTETIIL